MICVFLLDKLCVLRASVVKSLAYLYFDLATCVPNQDSANCPTYATSFFVEAAEYAVSIGNSCRLFASREPKLLDRGA